MKTPVFGIYMDGDYMLENTFNGHYRVSKFLDNNIKHENGFHGLYKADGKQWKIVGFIDKQETIESSFAEAIKQFKNVKE